MPLQYIKTLGGLVINDGNPNNDVNLTTGPPGSTGKVRINGNDGSGGGGGGGNVTKGGDNDFTGDNTFSGTLISTNTTDAAFQFNGLGNTVSTVGEFKAKLTPGSLAESIIRQDGTATFTGLVKCGDLGGQGTGNAIETKDDIECDGSIKLVPVAAGNDSIFLDGASMKITGRDIEAVRTAGVQGGEVQAHTLKANGTVNDASSIECSAEGSVRAQKYEVGNNASFPNHVNIFGRETPAGTDAEDVKTDCIIEMLGGLAPAGGDAGGTSEVYFENNASIANGPSPEYNRLCGINQDGFVSSRPIKYIGLKPSDGADAKKINYAYCAEVYDVYTNAGSIDPSTGTARVPARNFVTRITNDLTNDGNLALYLLFQMTASTDVKGNGAFPDAGFQSKYPQHKGANAGEAAPIITWNKGTTSTEPGVNHFVPLDPNNPGSGLSGPEKRKHWRISFEQVGTLLSTVAVGSRPSGSVVLEGFEGYVDVCIGDFPVDGTGQLQYKDVCYGASTNFLNSNAAIPSTGTTRTLNRGQVRLARRNQPPAGAVPGAWQFFIDFPSWDLAAVGGANPPSLTLNFTFTCIQ